MVTLPDPNSLPHFQWIDETGRTQPLHADVREVTDYVIDSNDWPGKEATVDSVLTKPIFDLDCEVCRQGRDKCKGQPCIDAFRNTIAAAGKNMCDIRSAGQKMGKGVFANRNIRHKTILGEYLGRLYPLGSPAARDPYVFLLNKIAEVSGLQYGNVTRFFNHHCHPNVEARLGMYGRRQVVLYEAGRDVAAGEQLCVDYGAWYFALPGNPCRCDAVEGEGHLPSTGRLVLKARTRSEAKAARAASASSARARDRRLDTLSKGAQRRCGYGISARRSKSTRNPTKMSSKKRKQSPSAGVLTRNAGVCRRYGPLVYTSCLRGNLKDEM